MDRRNAMSKSYPRFKAAACHVAPIFLDTTRTIDKTLSLIEEAADNGASIVAFPESFVPGFPVWAALRAPIVNQPSKLLGGLYGSPRSSLGLGARMGGGCGCVRKTSRCKNRSKGIESLAHCGGSCLWQDPINHSGLQDSSHAGHHHAAWIKNRRSPDGKRDGLPHH